MDRFMRKTLLSGLSLTTALLSAGVGAPQTAHAQLSEACVVGGSASISPGLNVVPGPEFMSFSGTIACLGFGLPQTTFGGTVTCGLGGLVTCVPFADFTLTSSAVGSCAGILLQVGLYMEAHCTFAGGALSFYWLLTSNNGTNLPVTSVGFTGFASAA